MTEFATWALHWAAQGLEVLPLEPRGKAPITPRGFYDATTDPEQITAWWNRTPHANVGARTPTGIAGIDIDPRAGGTLEQLAPVPDTFTTATGGGGLHLWFEIDPAAQIRGKVAGVDGIDIKHRNGYLVMPPSVHPNGNPYRTISDAPVAALPDHLRTRVLRTAPAPSSNVRSPASPRPGSSASLVRTVLSAPEGNRNNIFFWAACRAFERTATPELIDALRDAGAHVGLEHREIESTLASAAGRQGAA